MHPTPWIPPTERRGLVARMAIVLGIALLIGLMNYAMQPGGGPNPRRLDVSMVYTLGISLLTWLLVDLVRFPLRGLLRAPAPNYWPSGARAALLLVPGVALGYVGGTWLGDRYAGRSTLDLIWMDPQRFTGLLLGSLVVSALFIVFFYQRGRAASLARQAREAELRLLQSQLEPHMLFNTLANLRVLIALDPPRAQLMLDRLIGYLRSTLSASRAGTHTLRDEFARLADYLALMEVRMGPRLAVQLMLPPALAERPVPALLLQPLVENSIRHGLEPKVDGGRIEVVAEQLAGRLVLSVRDTGVGLPAVLREGGFGITQVRERLHTRYGRSAGLQLSAAPGGGALARIELPLEAAP